MRCPNCGAENDEDAVQCTVCGAPLEQKQSASLLNESKLQSDDPDEDDPGGENAGYYDEGDEDIEYKEVTDSSDEDGDFEADDPDDSEDSDSGDDDFDEPDDDFDDTDDDSDDYDDTDDDSDDFDDYDDTDDEFDESDDDSDDYEDDSDDTYDEPEDDSESDGTDGDRTKRGGKSASESRNAAARPDRNPASHGLKRTGRLLQILSVVAAALLILVVVLIRVNSRPEKGSQYLGSWKIVSVTTEGKEYSLEQIAQADTDGNSAEVMDSFMIDLKDTGKCTVSVLDKRETGTWKHTESGLTMTDDEKNTVILTDNGDGTLTLDMAEFLNGASVSARLQKDSGAGGAVASSSAQ